MTTLSGAALRRHFGQWSRRYNRFTVNLTSPKITVRRLAHDDTHEHGVECILHWVPRASMLSFGEGSVCSGDGWPVALWRRLTGVFPFVSGRSAAERLRSIASDPAIGLEDEMIAAWRSAISQGRLDPPYDELWADTWLPVPVELASDGASTACIVSWSPAAPYYESLTEAIADAPRFRRTVDPRSQSIYYLECALAQQHGVRFGVDDRIVDREYEASREVRRLLRSYRELEARRISDPSFGSLADRDPGNIGQK